MWVNWRSRGGTARKGQSAQWSKKTQKTRCIFSATQHIEAGCHKERCEESQRRKPFCCRRSARMKQMWWRDKERIQKRERRKRRKAEEKKAVLSVGRLHLLCRSEDNWMCELLRLTALDWTCRWMWDVFEKENCSVILWNVRRSVRIPFWLLLLLLLFLLLLLLRLLRCFAFAANGLRCISGCVQRSNENGLNMRKASGGLKQQQTRCDME